MANGLQAAIDNKHITNITKMTISLQAKRAACNQLLDPGADGVQATDVITPSEMIFLAAIGEISTEDTTHQILEHHYEPNDSDTPVLLCTDEDPTMRMEIPAIIPEDSSISKKIAERLNMSNYVISPIRKSYNSKCLTHYTISHGLPLSVIGIKQKFEEI